MPVYEIERHGRLFEIDSPTFPTKRQIDAAFAALPPVSAEEFSPAPTQPEGSAMGRAVSGAGQMLNPLTIAQGMYNAVRHPIDTATSIVDMHKAELEKGRQLSQEPGRGTEAAGHYLAATVPVLGPIAAQIGERIADTGDVATGVGQGAGLLATTLGGPAAVRAAGRAVGKSAKPLVRSAIKPTVTASRQQAGASMTGINAKADQLAQFIVDNGITSRAAAQAIITRAEGRIQQAVSGSKTPTDAPQRAAQYLAELEKSASRQGLGADDVATIRSAAEELMKSSPLSESVPAMVPAPMGTVMAGGPKTVPGTTRALRTDVMPDEALEIARGSSKWDTRRSWGEQKGASKEASKAVERGVRDAVKDAVPESRPHFQDQRMAIQARDALDRMAFREGNREPISPFDVTTGAVEVMHHGVPVLAIARHILRENKLRLGVWAKRLEQAVERNDGATAAAILDRFGVARATTTSPNESRGSSAPALAIP